MEVNRVLGKQKKYLAGRQQKNVLRWMPVKFLKKSRNLKKTRQNKQKTPKSAKIKTAQTFFLYKNAFCF